VCLLQRQDGGRASLARTGQLGRSAGLGQPTSIRPPGAWRLNTSLIISPPKHFYISRLSDIMNANASAHVKRLSTGAVGFTHREGKMNGAERISPYGLGVVYSRAGPSRTWNVVFPEVSRPPCSSCCNAGERVTARDLPFVTTFEDPFRQTSRRSLVATSLLPKEIRSAASQSRALRGDPIKSSMDRLTQRDRE
jgi:hypothetical protein